MYHEINECRICKNKNLDVIIELGIQTLTGVFPKSKDEQITKGPLSLVLCSGEESCGLVQLKHSFTLSEMYGANYGYRSGLNASMVQHLKKKVEAIQDYGILEKGDIILDIGSNDGTTLAQYPADQNYELIGIDPTAEKFSQYYKPHTRFIADFFNAENFKKQFGDKKAKIITSFSMFYDLEDPTDFVRQIAEIIDDNGIWITEQSYLPSMIETHSYDTICHEHLEYYLLSQIDWLAHSCGMKVVDVELNDVNGGSFSIALQKETGSLKVSDAVLNMRENEKRAGWNKNETFNDFRAHVKKNKEDLKAFFEKAKMEGKTIVALGASTKGNVLLQYCEITEHEIKAVGEVNPDKFGAFTPGTLLPIRDEKEILAENPDYVIVLPWHFRAFFDSQQKYQKMNMVYPLPNLTVRGKVIE